MKVLLVLAAFLLISGDSQARIGDTSAESIARFGNPVTPPNGDAALYTHGGWRILVYYRDGVAEAETYSKLNDTEINLSESMSLLKFASKDKDWLGPLQADIGAFRFVCGQLEANLNSSRATLTIGSQDHWAHVQGATSQVDAAPEQDSRSQAPPVASTGSTDLVTLFGKTYRGARLTKARLDGIEIFYVDGFAFVPLGDLPDDWRSRYAAALRAAFPDPASNADGGGSSGKGGPIYVHGYTRKDGTYVNAHTRKK